MASKASGRGQQASIGINKLTGVIQLNVPHGTTLVDAVRSLSKIDLSALQKLPRGCPACLSGHPFHIHEDFDPVIAVNLATH
jgi:hypothetical protein